MARPRKQPSEKRSHHVGVYFSDEDVLRVREDAAQVRLKPSQYLHSLALKKHLRPVPSIPELNVEAWLKLAPLASNLNQMIVSLNERQDVQINQDLLEQLRDELQSFRQQLLGDKG